MTPLYLPAKFIQNLLRYRLYRQNDTHVTKDQTSLAEVLNKRNDKWIREWKQRRPNLNHLILAFKLEINSSSGQYPNVDFVPVIKKDSSLLAYLTETFVRFSAVPEASDSVWHSRMETHWINSLGFKILSRKMIWITLKIIFLFKSTNAVHAIIVHRCN